MFLTFDWNVPTTVPQGTKPEPSDPSHQHPLPQPNPASHRAPLRRTVIEVEVAEKHEQGTDDEGKIWVAKAAPRLRHTRSLIVRLTSNATERGTGRLSMVTRLTRHWVSFKVHGVTPLTSLRVPMPWTKLSHVDQYEHMTQYATLSPYPLPFPGTIPPDAHHDEFTNPYDYDVTADDQYLARKLRNRTAGRQKVICQSPMFFPLVVAGACADSAVVHERICQFILAPEEEEEPYTIRPEAELAINAEGDFRTTRPY